MASLPFQVVFFDLGETLVTKPAVGTRMVWVPGAPESLDKLATLGIRLGVISNTTGLTRPQLLQLLPADFNLGRFETGLVILSSEIGDIEKPDPEIFRRAITAAGVAADQCLYCSESLLETLAAQRTGMRAARLQKPPDSDIDSLAPTLGQLSL
jgi:FMN phosphatase YigB (HAD superfamily)